MKKIALFLLMLTTSFTFAQKDVSGKVTDDSGAGLSGVNVKEKGTNNASSTDFDGVFKMKVKDGATLVFSYVGFSKIEKSTEGVSKVDVTMSATNNDTQLQDIVVVGTRTAPRSNTTSALPVDVLTAKDLTSTGQATFDKALQYRIPSFNTVQTPVNDATSLLDPYEIRNMGPSRTLILINGKRKNMSSLVYTQTSPGRGETGADISAIPQDAIERVEILRDGASAQYGSDAIAGVMNIILKKNTSVGSTTLRSGITLEGDGEMLGAAINNGSTVGDNGFINYTIDLSKTSLANRPGKVNADGEAADFGASLADVNAFLSKRPDAGNINGSPETAAAKFAVNGGTNYSDETQMYYNAAYVYKKVNSFANYRTPYWRSVAAMPYLASLYGNGTPGSYMGYVPTFDGDLNDYNATIGYKTVKNGWNADASLTTGGNSQMYTVTNSQNRSKDASGNFIYASNPNRYTGPITFKPGGTNFTHYVGNIDISKNFTDKLSFAIGSEFRTENFEVLEGDTASYIGGGADSFQGNTPENSGKFNRYNIGGYVDLAYDVTKDFLVNATARVENYSDFGNAFVWKISSRYKFADDKVTLRGSLSTGFRAPSLHQIYTQKSQSSFVAGQGIVVQGLINNVSSAALLNGVPKLQAEESTNFTIGAGLRPSKNFSVTLDYYNITVDKRIILGNQIDFGAAGSNAFFVNGLKSVTSGLDFVSSYRNLMVGSGKMAFNLSGNYTFRNERDGAINNPASVRALGQNVINATQEALLFTSRPKFKVIGGVDYEAGKWGFSLNNTMFGPTKFKNDGMSNDLRIEFLTKIVSDLGITYSATDKFTIQANINNLLNVLPEWEFKAENSAGQAILNSAASTREQFNLVTFNGRYSQMGYDGYHFSQLGTMLNLSLNYKF
jgi:iron complex outermembrane receptor protein